LPRLMSRVRIPSPAPTCARFRSSTFAQHDFPDLVRVPAPRSTNLRDLRSKEIVIWKFRWIALVLFAFGALARAQNLEPKKIKANANPSRYVSFKRVLPKEKRYRQALDRLTFGPRPGDLVRLKRIGLNKWLDLQLHPEQLHENATLTAKLAPLESLRMTSYEAYSRYPNPQMNYQKVIAAELTEGKLLRAIYSDLQLEELLADFWYNHFNVFLNKGADRYMVPTYEREAIRPHVLEKFYDLLVATAMSPAMLFYLDNWQSVAPEIADRPNGSRQRGLNENYGRELLELHTLGVNGGYTQKDVIEVARCFTGWTIDNPRKSGNFKYNDKVHDKGEKIVLGYVIPAGGGMNDGLEVLRILAHHPSTAHFISLKLAQRFVADDPPPSLVNRMAKVFLKTDGDLRQVMRTMLSSPEFWSEGAYQAKVKTPFEMVVSAVRATDADVQSAVALGNELQKLGEPLYRKMEPTGYSSANAEWVSSAGLLERMNFAMALAQNRISGVKVNLTSWEQMTPADPSRLASTILQENPSAQTEAAIQNALNQNAGANPQQLPSLVAGLVIGSPEFQRR
jgi:uncharacterized protein (DUF1800 family)